MSGEKPAGAPEVDPSLIDPAGKTPIERIRALEIHQHYAGQAIAAQTTAIRSIVDAHETAIGQRFSTIEKQLASIAERMDAANSADTRRAGIEAGIVTTLKVFWAVLGGVLALGLTTLWGKINGGGQ
jgi:hypothetical protein